MSALWFAVALAFAFVAGWTLCSYFEELGRVERQRRGRIVERAERDGRVAR